MDCGGFKSEPTCERCLTCTFRLRREAAASCKDCGKQPISSGSERCRPCRLEADRARTDTVGLLPRFNAAAFRDLLTRDDIEWTPPMLAVESGVTARSITSWLNGSTRPKTVEWGLVAKVLALKACPHCGGSGTIDPTAPDIASVTEAVQTPLVLIPRLDRLITGDGWTLDANTLVLSVGDTEIRTTRQEARLIAALAQAKGRFVTVAPLGAALKVGNQGARVYVSRLRDKCKAAGLDLDRVIQNSLGAGYRAVMPTAQEATG